MQYEAKDFKSTATIKLQWHGAPTRVLVNGEGVKREVDTGDVIEVSLEQAKTLIAYSPLWTKEGDKPKKQPYMGIFKPTKAQVKKEDKTGKDADATDLTVEAIDKLKSKKEAVVVLKARGGSFNDQATLDELKTVLKEDLEAKTAEANQTGKDADATGSANA